MPDNYRLRPVLEEDIERIRNWRNSDRIRTVVFNDEIIRPEQQREWFQKIVTADVDRFLILEYKSRPVGLISFTRLDPKNNTVHWGFYVGEEDVPAGMGSVLCILGLDHAFQELGVRRVIGEVLASNVRSLRLHEQLGFVREACLRAHVLKNGEYEDVICFGLLAGEWLAKRQEIAFRIFGKAIDGNPSSLAHWSMTDGVKP